MGVSVNLRGKGDMEMAVYDPDKDGVIGHKAGMYGGNNSVNRAIAHGLGVIPNHVLIAEAGGYIGQLNKARNGKIWYTFDLGRGEVVVTNMTAASFYVGNVANYFTSMNAGTKSYQWIAFD